MDIMLGVTEWENNLSNLVHMIKERYSAKKTTSYNAHNIFNDMAPCERTMMDRSFSKLGRYYSEERHHLRSSFINFLNTLERTAIGTHIIGIIPCDSLHHFICVTTTNVFGIEIHNFVKDDSIVFVTIYYDNDINHRIDTYPQKWKYRVSKFLSPDFKINISETEKVAFNPHFGEINLKALYASEDATYQAFVDGTKIAEMSYTYFGFKGAFTFFQFMEDVFLHNPLEDADEIYSIFCKYLKAFKVASPAEIKNASISILVRPEVDDNAFGFDNFISSVVSYHYDRLTSIQFIDEEGSHWYFSEHEWDYQNADILIECRNGQIAITTYYSMPNDENFKKYLKNWQNLRFSDQFENNQDFVNHIVQLASSKYIPEFFPKAD
ncbi:MAG: hypothetical protein IJ867_01400 [Clostridia bacterium]|nr:hypothetical protein [Clostridia bacterium]